jgi:hypothetical protein
VSYYDAETDKRLRFLTNNEVIRKGKANKPNEFGQLVMNSGGGEPDRYALPSVRIATGRLDFAGRISGATCPTVRTRSAERSGGSGIFLSR